MNFSPFCTAVVTNDYISDVYDYLLLIVFAINKIALISSSPLLIIAAGSEVTFAERASKMKQKVVLVLCLCLLITAIDAEKKSKKSKKGGCKTANDIITSLVQGVMFDKMDINGAILHVVKEVNELAVHAYTTGRPLLNGFVDEIAGIKNVVEQAEALAKESGMAPELTQALSKLCTFAATALLTTAK